MRSGIKNGIIACALLTSVFMSGCSILPGRGGSSVGEFIYGARDRSDKYKSAEEYCEYWFGPCEEVDSYTKELYDGTEIVYHVMKDKEFGFEYYVKEGETSDYFSGSDFAYCYINEFIKSSELKDITEEYGLRFENNGSKEGGSPSLRVYAERDLSAEDNKKILDTVMGKLGVFDAERNVFNKKHDNSSVFISVWSNPWEHDKKTGAKYHVENDTFGDNYQEQ